MMNQLRTEHQLSLRRVTDSDLATTYNWAIDKSIRAFSYSQNEISLEEHTAWFKSKLKSDDCYYYLSELEGKPAGSIRFDIRNNEAIISYLIDSSFQGRGLGIVLLKMGIAALIKENEPRIQKIVGYVMPENLASVRAFEKFGFTRGEEEGKLKYSISIL